MHGEAVVPRRRTGRGRRVVVLVGLCIVGHVDTEFGGYGVYVVRVWVWVWVWVDGIEGQTRGVRGVVRLYGRDKLGRGYWGFI